MTQMGRSCKVIQKQVKLCCFIPISYRSHWSGSRIELSSASMAAVNKYCVRGRADRWYTCSYSSCPY
jgi:hypothetical protein